MAQVKYQLLTPGNVPRCWSPQKILLVCGFALLLLMYHYWYGTRCWTAPINATRETVDIFKPTSEFHRENYFVNTPSCRMPALDPFTPDVLAIYKRVSPRKCSTGQSIVSVNYDESESRFRLHMNVDNVTCCYQQILRSGSNKMADNRYKLLACSNFHQDFVVPQDVDALITECRRPGEKSLLQKDAFSFVQPAGHGIVTNNSDGDSFEQRPSVLLWGFDSMSRMNFERTMPLMHNYLREENWFELRGYNKMGDNTFPNLMALLTGYNKTRSLSVCQPEKVGGLNDCPMLWNTYKNAGYVTGYGEDWSNFSTFNYIYKGFQNPPTDYYARPLILAVEHELNKTFDTSIPYCVGRRQFSEYIYDFALQFTKVHRNQSTFGMFWTNSFSHNNFALPSSMDAKIREYMRTLKKVGILKKSIILFFSDHGMRFGPLRDLHSGFLEERMPILYIWLPDWFKKKYPEYVHNLQLNRNRLTSPYDIHATLKHILELETPLSKLPRPEGCPGCHSVFHEVATSRNCADAGISKTWCSCMQFKEEMPNGPKAKKIAEQLVEGTNAYLAAKGIVGKCQTLKLTKVNAMLLVVQENGTEHNKSESYLVKYKAQPADSIFEALTKWNTATQRISIEVQTISRLTSYKEMSECVEDASAKKFCICKS